jgi:predicted dienelactone hydrolase
MRPFEILLTFLLIAIPLAYLIRPLARLRALFGAFSAALSVILLLQLFIERLRWQMVPLYLLALFWLYIFLREEFAEPAATPREPLKPHRRAAWIGLVLALLLCLPGILLPVPQLPQPSGPYAVGTTVFYWEDPSRPEVYSDAPDDTRRLMVQVWYPAEAGSGAALAPYLDNTRVALPALAKKFKLAPFLLSHLELARTHSLLEAPIAPGAESFPVLVFSHGWTGIRVQNTFQMEELASHGYILFAPDHTYGAMYTIFPDGEVVFNQRSALGSDNDPVAEYDRIARILGKTWVADLRFVLDQAEKVNSGEIASPLAGRLDLTRVGMLGHSTGGGAVVEACAVDARCKAGLSMDAWLIPYDRAIPAAGLDKPFFFMQSELWSVPRNPDLQAQLYQNMRAPAYRLTLLGASHYDFSDIPLLTPLAPLIGLKGPIDGQRSLALINQFSLAFFDQYLKGISSPLLRDASSISEVTLEVKD